MALHSELPIYKVAYDLLRLIIEVTRNLPRDVKLQVGGVLRDECVKITVLIFRANVQRDKAPALLELVERLQVAELLLRLSHDLRFIGQKQYAAAILLTTNIGKQANGWRKKYVYAVKSGKTGRLTRHQDGAVIGEKGSGEKMR